MKKPKYYAVINTKWEEDEWSDPFYESVIATRGRGAQIIYRLTVFNSKKEAQKYKNLIKNKIIDKIVEVSIIIKK